MNAPITAPRGAGKSGKDTLWRRLSTALWPCVPGVRELERSSTTAWGVVNSETNEIRAYPDRREMYEVAIASHDSTGPNLWIVYYHPKHGWIEWATGRRVRDGRKLRRIHG